MFTFNCETRVDPAVRAVPTDFGMFKGLSTPLYVHSDLAFVDNETVFGRTKGIRCVSKVEVMRMLDYICNWCAVDNFLKLPNGTVASLLGFPLCGEAWQNSDVALADCLVTGLDQGAKKKAGQTGTYASGLFGSMPITRHDFILRGLTAANGKIGEFITQHGMTGELNQLRSLFRGVSSAIPMGIRYHAVKQRIANGECSYDSIEMQCVMAVAIFCLYYRHIALARKAFKLSLGAAAYAVWHFGPGFSVTGGRSKEVAADVARVKRNAGALSARLSAFW